MHKHTPHTIVTLALAARIAAGIALATAPATEVGRQAWETSEQLIDAASEDCEVHERLKRLSEQPCGVYEIVATGSK